MMPRQNRNGSPRALGVLLGATLAAMAPARSAAAGDGVIEINQAMVLANGGFPHVIEELGSYQLTSDLEVPNENTTAIRVTAPNVTLDLRGFTISGVTVCTGEPANVTCDPSGTGKGIDGQDVAGIRVRNGTVRAMGDTGIKLGVEAIVEDVRVVSNGGVGIEVGGLSRLLRCVALRNGASGMSSPDLLGRVLVRDSTANQNGDSGILLFSASLAMRNLTVGNAGVGLHGFDLGHVIAENTSSSNSSGIGANHGSVVVHNTANENEFVGIGCGWGCVIRGNTASRNTSENIPSGIVFSRGAAVLGNTARGNGGHGLAGDTGGGIVGPSGIARNVLTGNALGAIDVGAGNSVWETGPNVCGADTSCP